MYLVTSIIGGRSLFDLDLNLDLNLYLDLNLGLDLDLIQRIRERGGRPSAAGTRIDCKTNIGLNITLIIGQGYRGTYSWFDLQDVHASPRSFLFGIVLYVEDSLAVDIICYLSK